MYYEQLYEILEQEYLEAEEKKKLLESEKKEILKKIDSLKHSDEESSFRVFSPREPEVVFKDEIEESQIKLEELNKLIDLSDIEIAKANKKLVLLKNIRKEI